MYARGYQGSSYFAQILLIMESYPDPIHLINPLSIIIMNKSNYELKSNSLLTKETFYLAPQLAILCGIRILQNLSHVTESRKSEAFPTD